ncbi:hypothetical protein PE36_11622 [Moritella sp. PE36]|nr:hypothetical protein PE36_11622 [Moritella sp. PE36]
MQFVIVVTQTHLPISYAKHCNIMTLLQLLDFTWKLMFNPELLPDITSYHSVNEPLALQWVGMEDIAVPFSIALSDGKLLPVAGKADLLVSLDQPDAKGIHMSRLYLHLNEQLANKKLDKTCLSHLLELMVSSQKGISKNAKIKLKFDVILEKSALLSNEMGYQSYPVTLSAQRIHNEVSYVLELSIPYSSTCPCSASLSQQLYGAAINEHFSAATIDKQDLLQWVESKAGSVATPHSQRSYAYLKLILDNQYLLDIQSLIFKFEKLIATPVQTAVKREDEQEFARLNAENLMFCEDAARRIKGELERMKFVTDYWFKVEHQESLHAHNAVVIDQKQRM